MNVYSPFCASLIAVTLMYLKKKNNLQLRLVSSEDVFFYSMKMVVKRL